MSSFGNGGLRPG